MHAASTVTGIAAWAQLFFDSHHQIFLTYLQMLKLATFLLTLHLDCRADGETNLGVTLVRMVTGLLIHIRAQLQITATVEEQLGSRAR